MQQLVHNAAQAVLNAAVALRFVPLVVYVQKLAKLRPTGDASGSNILLEYIRIEFAGNPAVLDMLMQAFELRALILLLHCRFRLQRRRGLSGTVRPAVGAAVQTEDAHGVAEEGGLGAQGEGKTFRRGQGAGSDRQQGARCH